MESAERAVKGADATEFVESREAMRESGDVLLAGASVYVELGEVLDGRRS
jgi:hypothetical protein